MTCKDIADLQPLYLSGELDAERAAAFAAHLAECEPCAQDTERQTEFDQSLRNGARAEHFESTPVEKRIRARIAAERRPRMAWAGVAAGVAAVIALGVFGSRVLLMQPTDPLCKDAADDHRAEVVNAEYRAWRTTVPQIQVLADRPGVDVPLKAPPGYRLDRGKLCRLEGQVYLHLVYTNGHQEFSMFLRHRGPEMPPGQARDSVNGRPLYTVDRGKEHIAFLQTDRLTAVIVTDQSSDAALSLARFAASSL